MDELKFKSRLERCSRCHLPIVDDDDLLIYAKHSFSFPVCKCNSEHPLSGYSESAQRNKDFSKNAPGIHNLARDHGQFGSSPEEDHYDDEDHQEDFTDPLG